MSVLYTIGYEGTDIDRFIATLKAVGVETVADVRALALSRKKGFSKTALKSRLESEGIQYLHFVKLGDPKPGREAARAGKFIAFNKIYNKHLAGTEAQAAIKELASVVKTQITCLLCFERDPVTCHRTIVAKQLRSAKLDVFDLYGDLPRRYDNYTKLARHRFSESASAAQ